LQKYLGRVITDAGLIKIEVDLNVLDDLFDDERRPEFLRFCRRQFFFPIVKNDLMDVDIAAVSPEGVL
jgi:hypothetical protein